MSDPGFAATTLVVNFEGLTPVGLSVAPIEVAVPTLRPVDGLRVEVGRFEELIQPPADAPERPPYRLATQHASTEVGFTAWWLLESRRTNERDAGDTADWP